MNFTREPIIETIISARDGFKLLVRPSKGGETEEYLVDALEVVSFGQAFFFRSLEKPKSFLVPANDYEVVEVKETRVALKNMSHEKTIKIGGGKEASIRGNQSPAEKEAVDPLPPSDQEAAASQETASQPQGQRDSLSSRRRDRRRHRRRRGDEQWQRQNEQPKEESSAATEAAKAAAPLFSGLFPPPPALISETLSRYKGQEFFEKDKESKEEEKKEPPKEEPPAAEGDSNTMNRMHADASFLSIPASGFDPFF